jgi:hypothetical protein
MLEISNSSLNLYRLCPKRYYWHYIEDLTPRKTHAGLILGTTIHKAFDLYYKGSDMKSIVAYIDKTYKDTMATLPPEDQEQCYIDSKTAMGMFLNFPFNQMVFDKIESEREFRLPIMKGIEYVGRIDGKVEEKGHKWIRELKTTGEVRSMFENRASVSSQATGYTWAMTVVDKEPIVGVLYDGIRKPRLIKKVSEDMYEFGQRVYLDYCDEKKKESYFYRYPTYRTTTDVELWLEDTKSVAKSIKRAREKCDFPRNTGSCWVFNKECEYRRICMERKPDPMVVDLLFTKGGDDGEGTEEGNGGGTIGSGAGGTTNSTWQ